MDYNIVSKTWVGMSATNIHLLQFKIQSYLQKQTLNSVTSELVPQKKLSKISNITFAILLFLIEILELNCHPEYFGIYFSWWNHQMRLKMVHSYIKDAKPTGCQSQVCCLCTTHSSSLKHVKLHFHVILAVFGSSRKKEWTYWIVFFFFF